MEVFPLCSWQSLIRWKVVNHYNAAKLRFCLEPEVKSSCLPSAAGTKTHRNTNAPSERMPRKIGQERWHREHSTVEGALFFMLKGVACWCSPTLASVPPLSSDRCRGRRGELPGNLLTSRGITELSALVRGCWLVLCNSIPDCSAGLYECTRSRCYCCYSDKARRRFCMEGVSSVRGCVSVSLFFWSLWIETETR